jgi:Pregnancy-associated plasma protein-A/Secretion system C-terminal sorting domain
MTKRFLFTLVLFCVAIATQLSAQRNCASHDVLQQQLQNDPALQSRMDAIEQQVAHYLQQNGGSTDRAVITIPVVFHVVYRTTAENISDAQVLSQLAVLNADFRATNSDIGLTPALFAGLVADSEIEFCMAQRDPAGAATTGITRKSTTVTAWGTNDNVKKSSAGGVNPWNRDQYLNIWVCNIGGGILGYAQFPGGSATTDGVVLDYRYTGTMGTATAPFNKGRTATHEVGHWLNLRHIWGDANCGSDLVGDTPTHNTSNGGCPAYPHLSTCSGTPVEMTMNYMDYTDDVCMYMFSAGQKTRMRAVVDPGGARATLASSPGCTPSTGGATCGIPASTATSSITSSGATLGWAAVTGATSYTVEWKLGSASTWTTIVGLSGTSTSLSGLTASTAYNWRVTAVCGATTGTATATVAFTTLAGGGGGGCTDIYEANNTRNTSKTIGVNTNIGALIGTSTDVDWFRFANTSAARNIKLDLTTLPADYDLKLYRSSTLLATSENLGTASESIIYNTTTVSTAYYANVYGYGGVFNATQCYTLRASISSSTWRTDGTTDGEVTDIEIPVEVVAFGMWPNPASEMITLDLPTEQDGNAQVRIMDMAGRTIQIQEVPVFANQSNVTDLPLSNMASGIYYVQVRNGQETATRKLVVNQR